MYIDKSNNDPDNLRVFRSQDEHDTVHEVDAILYGERASYQRFRNRKTRFEWLQKPFELHLFADMLEEQPNWSKTPTEQM